MKRKIASAAVAVLVSVSVLLGASAASAENKCHLGRVAELPVTVSGMRALVTLKINGADAPFVLDTGAWYSMITPAAAARLKLRIEAGDSIRMTGIGGEAYAGVGTAKEITFGGTPIKDVQFLVGGRSFGELSVGLLGQNFLERFDVEYDLANGVVRLFVPHDCHNVGLGYWAAGKADIMPIDPTDAAKPHIVAHAQLNGHKVKLMFDSGAPGTILDKDAADKAGLPRDQDVAAGQVIGGIGRGLVETWIAPVTNLDLGDEQIQKTHLRVGNLRMDDADMLVGMDFFLSHHLLVSHSQNRMYFTYNGGPVFDIGRGKPPGARAVAGGGDGDGDKLSAEELQRRAKASIARRDLTAAIADLTRAAELEPQNPTPLSDRAIAHFMSGDMKAGREDLDKALKLKPDDVPALRARGLLYVREGDLKAAQADFDAAAKAAPDDDQIRFRFAGAFSANGHYDLAIRQFDLWLAEHPKSTDAWRAYNGRCWQRTMWNRQLPEALADCEMAVKKGAANSEVLDSRGMTHLRLGQYQQAVADYDNSLKKQSKNAWGYLGRGLAKEKLGDAAGAEADIRQAVALDAGIGPEARKVGLDSPLLPKADVVKDLMKKEEKHG